MADAKAVLTERFNAARAALTAGDEPAAAESLHAAVIAARGDPRLRRELVTALFHLGKLSRKFGRAGEREAELLLTEALTISEELVGREHAALAPLLSELSRLHVQRSQHARAGDVLQRLLAIVRAKGEENADVATALAGLAVVKHKLGDDASAEALYRDALRIREKVLGPNHIVTVVTREQLSATCAARGNFGEALTLLRGALATREVALGPGHATVQAARSRVAELEVQVAVAADAAAAAKAAKGAIPTPAWSKRVSDSPNTPSTTAPSPIISKKPDSLDEPESPVLRPAALSRERAKTPTVTAAVAAASLMASSIQMPSASQIVISRPPRESARQSGSVASLESGVPQRDAVLADVTRNDVASADAALGDWQSTIAPVQADLSGLARRQRTLLYTSVGLAAVAIAGLLMLRPRVGSGTDPVSAQISAAPRTAATGTPVVTASLTRTGSTASGAAAIVEAMGVDSLVSSSATHARTAPVGQASKRAQDSAPSELRLPRVDVHLRPIKIPNVTVPSIDSIVRSATERQRASDSDRTGTADRVSVPTPTDVDRAAANNAITPAKIIGRPPAPRFPDALLRTGLREGRVVVRFMVNEYGTVDVGSMIVEQSDHALFTSAVRDILPRFRFEPARTHAPESKVVASWVSVPFRFTMKEK